MSETTALQIVPKHALTTLVFGSSNPIQALETVGGIAARSGAFGFANTQSGAVAVITCMETGITLTEYHRTYDTVEGKPRKKAMAALVEFEKSGGKFDWLMTGDEPTTNPDDRKAVLHLERNGKTRDYTYSMKDARDEGLVKPGSRWVKRPGNMLRARCITNGLGLIAPEIFAGEYDESESTTPPLLVETAPKVVATVEAPAARAETIDVASVVIPAEDEKELAEAGLAPKPFAPADVRRDEATGKLSQETVIALENAIASEAPAACEWLKTRGWISTELADLSAERARRILDKPAVFIAHVKEGAK